MEGYQEPVEVMMSIVHAREGDSNDSVRFRLSTETNSLQCYGTPTDPSLAGLLETFPVDPLPQWTSIRKTKEVAVRLHADFKPEQFLRGP